MGGCASKPKDLDIKPESIPAEAPAVPETVVAQEAPLVDLSEPKEEVVEAADVATTTEEATEKPSEENVEVAEPVKEEESAAAAEVAVPEAESSEDKSDAPLVTV